MRMKISFVLFLTHYHHLGQFIGIQNDSYFIIFVCVLLLLYEGQQRYKKKIQLFLAMFHDSLILFNLNLFSQLYFVHLCAFFLKLIFIFFCCYCCCCCLSFNLNCKKQKNNSMQVCKLNLKIDVVHYTALFFKLKSYSAG